MTFLSSTAYFHMSHFPTSQPTTAFYPKLGCIQFSFQKLEMLTPIHNDADDTDDADDYNRVICIALLKAFNCAKNTRAIPGKLCKT